MEFNTPEANEIFEKIFNEIDTYEELPKMIHKAAYDVARTELDGLKQHSICYHMSGMVDIVLGVKEAIEELELEKRILDIDLESEIDEEQLEKYNKLKHFLENFE